jgi:hypothetical protein
MPATPERSTQARHAAHRSWGLTSNRTARTAPAREALEAKWLREAEGDVQRAESLRKAHYLGMARKSAEARRRGRQALALVHRLGATGQLEDGAA